MNSKIIEIKNLSYFYKKKEIILNDISFDIFKGENIAITGPNGSGKSTLIKLIVGFLKPLKKNSIKINGKISYVPQKYNQDSNFPAKVSEILELECCKCNLRNDVVKSLDLKKIENSQFKDLSGGQQQRVLIAISLLSNPDILILDEPTVGIDKKTQQEFYNLLKDLNKQRNLTILFITHDTGMINNYFDKIICVHNKNICIDDAKNTSKLLHKTYGCDFSELNHTH